MKQLRDQQNSITDTLDEIRDKCEEAEEGDTQEMSVPRNSGKISVVYSVAKFASKPSAEVSLNLSDPTCLLFVDLYILIWVSFPH